MVIWLQIAWANFCASGIGTVKVPWLYDADTGTMITYDDPELLALKANYVKERNLGGIMIWELAADDRSHSLLNAVYDTLNVE
jgi:chitinase